MGAVASTAVTLVKSWGELNHSQKLNQRCVEAQVVLSSQGGETNSIGAALFGLSYIREVTCSVTSTNKWYPAMPSYDGTLLLMTNPANATDANRIDPADITFTVRVVVKGY